MPLSVLTPGENMLWMTWFSAPTRVVLKANSMRPESTANTSPWGTATSILVS